MTSEAAEGDDWKVYVHPDDRQRVLDEWQIAIHTGTTYEVEYRLRDGISGTYRWFLTRGVSFKDNQGTILQWFGTCTDINEQKLAEEVLRQSQERAHALMNFNLNIAGHGLRTLLTFLKLQTQMLKKKLSKQHIHDVDAALSRMEGQLSTINRLVEELFDNLISNAIKYSPAADTVEGDISTSAEAVTISGRDQGIGIPQEQHTKIFERFYRAVTEKRHGFPGLGMGLSIVAEIVKHHGGTITVESEMGAGSTFVVTLLFNR